MPETRHPLKITVLKVLEDWAMMLIDEVNEISEDFFSMNERLFASSIHFKGTISGTVSIVAQQQFLSTLTTSLLGNDGDSEIPETDCLDAFREMGNVLAGNFLTEAYGADVVFELLNPKVTELTSGDLISFTQRKVVFAFLADEQPVMVTFNLDQE